MQIIARAVLFEEICRWTEEDKLRWACSAMWIYSSGVDSFASFAYETLKVYSRKARLSDGSLRAKPSSFRHDRIWRWLKTFPRIVGGLVSIARNSLFISARESLMNSLKHLIYLRLIMAAINRDWGNFSLSLHSPQPGRKQFAGIIG